MRKYLFAFLLFILLSANVFADLEITVEYDRGWGKARTQDIKKLCENIVLHFQEQLRDEQKISGELTIVYHSSSPIAFYRKFLWW